MVSRDLMTGEVFVTAADVSLMCYRRRGRQSSAPLMIFIPGGGHLGRVSYGYDGGARHDFLDYWLEEAGYGLLAVSAPAGPPFTPTACPNLSPAEWGRAIAALAESTIEETGCRRSVVILAWSLGSVIVGHLARSLGDRGVEIAGFMPLAANPPPIPLGVGLATDELFEDGLWNVTGSRVFGVELGETWITEIAAAESALGRNILSADNYRAHFWVSTPPGLRGGSSKQPDAGSTFLPLAGAIVPEGQIDYRHAIGDLAAWFHANTQTILLRYTNAVAANGLRLQPDSWRRLVALVQGLADYLTARVPGGHLFFIGEPGAMATVEAILLLLNRIDTLEKELEELLAAPRPASVSRSNQKKLRLTDRA